MCSDYVERFALFLNDLDGSMKLPYGKYPLENIVNIKTPLVETFSGNNHFATNEKAE